MAYRCLDCSYTGRQFPQGCCPACGSANIAGSGQSDTPKKPHSRWSLLALVGLWGLLIYLLLEKFTGP